MARQLVLTAIALIAVSCATVAQAAKPKPECSNSYATGTSFSTFDKVCAQVTDPEMLAEARNLKPLIRLEVIETCSCALLNHDLAWAALMTHDSEVLYLSIQEFIDASIKKDADIQKLVTSTTGQVLSGSLFADEEGERRIYWDGLDHILRQATGETDDDRIFLEIRKLFAKIYYDPTTMRQKFNIESNELMVQSQKLRTVVSEACISVLKNFGVPILPFFDKLRQFSGNDRLFFTLAAYNDDLYKLRINAKMCLYLKQHGQLVGDF